MGVPVGSLTPEQLEATTSIALAGSVAEAGQATGPRRDRLLHDRLLDGAEMLGRSFIDSVYTELLRVQALSAYAPPSFTREIRDAQARLFKIEGTELDHRTEGRHLRFGNEVVLVRGDLTTAEHPPPGTTEIHGRDYSSLIGAFPTDGIGLHPTRERVFWSTLGNRRLYSLSAAKLRDFTASKADIAARASTIVGSGSSAVWYSPCSGFSARTIFHPRARHAASAARSTPSSPFSGAAS